MDPERNVKRLRKLFGVSRTMLKRAARRPSVSDQEREDQQRRRFQLLRELRQQRISSLGPNQRYVLEICADLLGIDPEEIVSGIVDESKYVENLNGIFEEKGPMAIMISNATMLGYPTDSGRYQEKLKYTEIQRTVCLRSDSVDLIGKWTVVYRLNHEKSIDNRSVSDEVAIFMITAEEQNSCLNVVKTFMDHVLKPSIEAVTEFGLAEKEQTQKFFHILNMYNTFLKSSEATVSSRVHFDISHELFKGLLLVRWQIEASSKIVTRVRLVEHYFEQWLRQIQGILVEGKQIQRDTPEVGPLQMLVNWRRMLARYTTITEFVTSRAFNNHKDCLTLSRSSKLLNICPKGITPTDSGSTARHYPSRHTTTERIHSKNNEGLDQMTRMAWDYGGRIPEHSYGYDREHQEMPEESNREEPRYDPDIEKAADVPRGKHTPEEENQRHRVPNPESQENDFATAARVQAFLNEQLKPATTSPKTPTGRAADT
ncbi:LOW QUALITY PROTEIN: uncharacterized protein Dere_GG23061, partial [Drosophila erecta]